MNMLFGESNKKTCPQCAQEFYPGDCRIMSTIHSGTVLKEAPSGWKRQRARLYPEPLTGDLYVDELARRECPHCKYLLPYNVESVDAKSIVIIGDTNAGKSHFIAALIRQIESGRLYDPNYSTRFVCLTPDVLDEYNKDYLDPLFKRKEQLPNTQPATLGSRVKDPLIYELLVKKSPMHPARRTNLILYDASGEDYANANKLVQYTRYVLNASGMIFLADPISMPDILDRLPAHLQNQTIPPRRASNVLSSVLQLIERKNGLEAGSRFIQMPVAITISKSDLLKYLRGANDPYSFLKNPPHGYGSDIDLEDMANVDREVREILAGFGDRTLLHTADVLKSHFFAVSATGYPPKADSTYPAIEPRRCLDPVLWLLYQLGVVGVK